MATLGPGCRQRETLQYLCEQIPGDALLYSMFKENAEAVKCPLKGELDHFFLLLFVKSHQSFLILLIIILTLNMYKLMIIF